MQDQGESALRGCCCLVLCRKDQLPQQGPGTQPIAGAVSVRPLAARTKFDPHLSLPQSFQGLFLSFSSPPVS